MIARIDLQASLESFAGFFGESVTKDFNKAVAPALSRELGADKAYEIFANKVDRVFSLGF